MISTFATFLLGFTAAAGLDVGARVPVQIALTFEGVETSSLSTTLGEHIRDTYGVEPLESVEEGGQFHVHLSRPSPTRLGVRIDEGGALIAERELESEPEIWLLIKSSIRRALLAPAPRRVVRASPVHAGAAPENLAVEITGIPALARRQGWSIHALGGVEWSMTGMSRGGALGADLQLQVGKVDLVSGVELGYARSSPLDGTFSISRVPLTLFSGVGFLQGAPIIVGAFATVEHIHVSSLARATSGLGARVGPWVRARWALSDNFDLALDTRVQFPIPNVRYVLDYGQIVEGPASLSVGAGMEWRWR